MSISVQQWDDPATWNAFVASTPDAHFQQSWEWGELGPYLGSRSLRLAAVEAGELVACMQLFLNPLRGVGKTQLYVPRGPAMAAPEVNVLAPLLDAARLAGKAQSAAGIRIEPNVPACNPGWRRSLETLGFHPSYPPSQPRSSWVLDIDRRPDDLLGEMKQKTRYNIRLAARKGVEVIEGGPEDYDTFYALYEETAARDDFVTLDRSVYRRMFELFREAGAFCMLLARFEGEVLAAATLVRFGTTCWYLHGASSDRHRNVMATYLLQWHAILWAQQQGCSLYDFRAVPDVPRADQDMYGVYRFKEGFGGRQVTVMHTHSAPYQAGLFGLWQLYFRARFSLTQWQRRRKGLPVRQFA